MTSALRVGLLLLAAAAAALWLSTRPPIPQPAAYHDFADQRALLGVPHALNVLSNAPLALVGAAGLRALAARRGPGGGAARAAYAAFFAGVGLSAAGSAYYHLSPDNGRLLWDRLPMAVAFTALSAAIIAERIGGRAGAALLAPLLAAGAWSVLHWHETERQGRGDLRPYYFVQFFPLLALPLILALFPAPGARAGPLLAALGWYAAAKLCEHPLDGPIFALGGVVSGHTLKHLAAALAAYQLVPDVRRGGEVGASARPAGGDAGDGGAPGRGGDAVG